MVREPFILPAPSGPSLERGDELAKAGLELLPDLVVLHAQDQVDIDRHGRAGRLVDQVIESYPLDEQDGQRSLVAVSEQIGGRRAGSLLRGAIAEGGQLESEQ